MTSDAAPADAVLVCGLGRNGLECIKALRGYRVPVHAIDIDPPAEVHGEVASVVTGDFRRPEILRRAGIARCRSIVLLSGDSAANLEGALAARRANPHVRLVVRGEPQNLHALLSQRLGNLVVYEPNLMAAPAFAFAALDRHVLAHFYVDDQLFQIIEHTLKAGDSWIGSPIEHAHVPNGQLLLHRTRAEAETETEASPAGDFFGWEPGRAMQVGDRVVVLRAGRPSRPAHPLASQTVDLESAWRLLHRVQRRFAKGFGRPAEVALIGSSVMCALLLISVLTVISAPLHMTLARALRLAVMLLTGSHLSDVFNPFISLPPHILWLETVMSVMGTVLTAVLYALLTDRLLTARFALARRPQPPAHDHVVVAGLGATGERIVSVLHRLHRPVVAIDRNPVEAHTLPKLAIVRGNATDAETLADANLATAHGIVAATPDDMQNVEIAMLAHDLNPACRIAIRTSDARFSENVAFLLPRAKVLCVSSLAASAYAAAALGEHVISLFQLLDKPVLVVEYTIAEGDTLAFHPLWEIAEGYRVVPVLLQGPSASARVLSSEDASIQLQPGDRLVVLATAASLEAIEHGDLRQREYVLELRAMRPYAESLQVVGLLAHRLGYSLERARDALSHLPRRVPQRLYGIYASRTQRLLHANGMQTTLTRCVEGQ